MLVVKFCKFKAMSNGQGPAAKGVAHNIYIYIYIRTFTLLLQPCPSCLMQRENESSCRGTVHIKRHLFGRQWDRRAGNGTAGPGMGRRAGNGTAGPGMGPPGRQRDRRAGNGTTGAGMGPPGREWDAGLGMGPPGRQWDRQAGNGTAGPLLVHRQMKKTAMHAREKLTSQACLHLCRSEGSGKESPQSVQFSFFICSDRVSNGGFDSNAQCETSPIVDIHW